MNRREYIETINALIESVATEENVNFMQEMMIIQYKEILIKVYDDFTEEKKGA